MVSFKFKYKPFRFEFNCLLISAILTECPRMLLVVVWPWIIIVRLNVSCCEQCNSIFSPNVFYNSSRQWSFWSCFDSAMGVKSVIYWYRRHLHKCPTCKQYAVIETRWVRIRDCIKVAPKVMKCNSIQHPDSMQPV